MPKLYRSDEMQRLILMEMMKIDEKDIVLDNPLLKWDRKDLENPGLAMIRMMRQPDYIFFTCKHVLNVKLLPYQQVILQEMWKSTFPMLVASRGAGKCTSGDAYVVSDYGFSRIADFVGDSPPHSPAYKNSEHLLGESGWNQVEYGWNNGIGPTKKIFTSHGYTIENTHNHPIRVVRGESVEWVNSEDVKPGDYVAIDRSTTWPRYPNALPSDLAYAFGLIIGDGGLTARKRISFTTADTQLVEALSSITEKYWGKRFRKQNSAKYGYLLCDVNIYQSLFDDYGFKGVSASDKDFPGSVMCASREGVAAFIRGLMDTDGSATKRRCEVEFASKSYRLAQTLHFMLTRFGIVSRLKKRRNKKYNRDYYYIYITGNDAKIFGEEIGFGLQRKQAILESHGYKCVNTNKDLLPRSLVLSDLLALRDRWADVRTSTGRGRQLLSPSRLSAYELSYKALSAVLNETESLSYSSEWQRLNRIVQSHYFYDKVKTVEDGYAETFDVHMISDEDRSFISNGFISHNSFLLAVYAILRALFMQGRKVVITGSGFRQAKTIMNYIETIWGNAPILRSLVMENSRSGSHHDADRWVMRLGDSTITALPLGDGQKIRGERAHDIIADEFACVDATTLVETTYGLKRIVDCHEDVTNLRLFSGDGQEVDSPERFIVTPPTEVYKIITMGGYETLCSNKHQVFTSVGWKLGKDLTKQDKLYFNNTYRFPVDYIQDGLFTVDENAGWLMGILVSEGSINRIQDAWESNVCNLKMRNKLAVLGLERRTSHNKRVPWSILQSPREVVIAFLAGLFEGDGSAFLWTDRNITNKLGIAYYTVSETLAREVQILLQKLNIFCSRQTRASKLSDKPQWMLRLNGINALRLCKLLQIKKWETIYKAAWKDKSAMKSTPKYLPVRSVELLPEKRNLYDFHLPKTHSFVGNCFVQHNSIPRETFETVVAGFGVVELDPYDKVERQAEIAVLKNMGAWSAEMEENARLYRIGNQSIISGTAYFQFNHFAEYWKKWHGIISSRGNKEKLSQVLGMNDVDDIDWRDYAILRLPYELLPPGYMDERHVARSKATVHSGIFLNEFGAIFSSDTNGFFKRSLVESCVVNTPILVGGEYVQFRCVVRGNPNGRYVYGVDPASESDRFSIIILELHETHNRIVYCWTTDKAEHTKRLESGIPVERDFYGFCARKIRDLMKVFPCEHIAIDSQGGGIAVREALHDTDKLEKNEVPIWEIKGSHPFSDGKEKPTDRYSGLHILELCNFARAEYMSESNHGLRKDFEDKVTLFPMSNDTTTLAIAFEADQIAKRNFDTYEDCFYEIEELKEELATIVHTQTPGSNRDRWDTPEVKLAGSRRGRLRKDRYSSLVMANYAARRISRKPQEVEYTNYGGFVGRIKGNDNKNSPAYVSGPDWFVNPVNANSTGYGKIIKHGVR